MTASAANPPTTPPAMAPLLVDAFGLDDGLGVALPLEKLAELEEELAELELELVCDVEAEAEVLESGV